MRKKHTGPQIVAKPRQADVLLGQGSKNQTRLFHGNKRSWPVQFRQRMAKRACSEPHYIPSDEESGFGSLDVRHGEGNKVTGSQGGSYGCVADGIEGDQNQDNPETVAKIHCKRYQDLLHVNFLSKMCIVRYSSWQHLVKQTPVSIIIVKQVA